MPPVTPTLADSPLLRACRREPLDSPPIWLMRQAGRYMKEYRDLREKVPFLTLCHDADLITEVTVHAAKRLGVDAAIIFSDLLLPLEPLGFRLAYDRGEGPSVEPPLRSAADLKRLRTPDVPAELGYVFESIRRTRAALPADMPLLGFAGAPFTLASYLIEGGGSAHYRHTKEFLYSDPGAWNALLERLVELTATFLKGQIDAGAQAVQIFDSWVGCLAPDDYRRFVLPHVKRLVAQVRPHAPVILFGTQTTALLEAIAEAQAPVVGVDWRVDLIEAWDRLGPGTAIMGNLDPCLLFAPRDEVVRRARALLQRAAHRPGWIFNLGHGILPHTPVDNVLALVETVHAWDATRAAESDTKR
ncbi:MAG TPA: uroporphyrinogen decarboxylase [Candidatus Polarisedimenticolia bacterium]|nr:uroporphyrinogen decarboxylase [Candidatus Polarisedimenticolia bacterium]